MSFLDKKLGDMSEAELIRLIKRTIQQEVPPIPATISALPDAANPILAPPAPSQGQAMTYDVATGQWTNTTITTGTVATDGTAPGSSPTPTATGGLGYLAIKWTPVANKDLVIYEVHVSTASGFTPGAGTKVGETPGALAFSRKDAAGADLQYDTDYYVKIIARDTDGSAAASAQAGPVQLDRAGSQDITVGAITAEHIESVFNYSSAFVAGAFGGANVQVGFGVKDDGAGNPIVDSSFIGIRAYDGDPLNTAPIFKLPADGSPALFRGTVQFGSHGLSKLLPNDMVQIEEQPGGAFATPILVQTASNVTQAGGASITCEFDTAPVAGNVVIAVMTNWDAGGAGAGTWDAGSGSAWTLLHSAPWADSNNARTQVYAKVVSGTKMGAPGDPVSVSIDKNADAVTLQILEYSGVTVTENVTSLADSTTANGVQTLNTTSTASITQQCLVLGIGACEGLFQAAKPPSSGKFPSIKTSSYPSDKPLVSQAETDDFSLGLLGGNDIETNVFAKVASSGTQSMICETNGDCLSGFACIIALEAAAASVQSADANTARLYGADISGKTYMHHVDQDGRKSSVALGANGEVFRFDLQSFNHNFNGGAAIGAHSGGSDTHTITCDASDFCILAEYTGGENYLLFKCDVTAANTVTIRFFNADSVARTPGSGGITPLVIHRT